MSDFLTTEKAAVTRAIKKVKRNETLTDFERTSYEWWKLHYEEQHVELVDRETTRELNFDHYRG